MNTYKRYKNRLEKFLQTERGKRFINYAYSIGAAIVILGAMFKLLHFPFGNELLFIGMITEVIVFTLSAFDTPIRDYNWDKVFPALTSDKPVNQSDLNSTFNNTMSNYSNQANQNLHEKSGNQGVQNTQGVHETQQTTSNLTTNNIDITTQTVEYNRQMEKLIKETEKMGKQLQELNDVYARMLKAMSVNRDNLSKSQ